MLDVEILTAKLFGESELTFCWKSGNLSGILINILKIHSLSLTKTISSCSKVSVYYVTGMKSAK